MATASAHFNEQCAAHIPPVNVNIRAMGSLVSNLGLDLWMSYKLEPLQDCPDRLGSITQSLAKEASDYKVYQEIIDLDLNTQWVVQSVVDTQGDKVYMICLPRLLGCIQLFDSPGVRPTTLS